MLLYLSLIKGVKAILSKSRITVLKTARHLHMPSADFLFWQTVQIQHLSQCAIWRNRAKKQQTFVQQDPVFNSDDFRTHEACDPPMECGPQTEPQHGQSTTFCVMYCSLTTKAGHSSSIHLEEFSLQEKTIFMNGTRLLPKFFRHRMPIQIFSLTK